MRTNNGNNLFILVVFLNQVYSVIFITTNLRINILFR